MSTYWKFLLVLIEKITEVRPVHNLRSLNCKHKYLSITKLCNLLRHEYILLYNLKLMRNFTSRSKLFMLKCQTNINYCNWYLNTHYHPPGQHNKSSKNTRPISCPTLVGSFIKCVCLCVRVCNQQNCDLCVESPCIICIGTGMWPSHIFNNNNGELQTTRSSRAVHIQILKSHLNIPCRDLFLNSVDTCLTKID